MSIEKILNYYESRAANKVARFHPDASEEVRQGLSDLIKHPYLLMLVH